MIIPPGFAQITHTFTGVAMPGNGAITHGILTAGAPSLTELAEEIALAFDQEIWGFCGSQVIHATTILKEGPNSTGRRVEVPRFELGGDGSDPASPQVSYLVQKQTDTGGRTGRGRFYLPGVVDPAVEFDGTVETAKQAQLQGGVDAYLAFLDTNTSPMYLFSATASDPKLVTELVVDGRVATQRNRLRS